MQPTTTSDLAPDRSLYFVVKISGSERTGTPLYRNTRTQAAPGGAPTAVCDHVHLSADDAECCRSFRGERRLSINEEELIALLHHDPKGRCPPDRLGELSALITSVHVYTDSETGAHRLTHLGRAELERLIEDYA